MGELVGEECLVSCWPMIDRMIRIQGHAIEAYGAIVSIAFDALFLLIVTRFAQRLQITE